MKIFPFVVDTAAHADYQTTIAKELQEDLDTVKHMTQAKDQQISELEKELKKAKLEQKCKWRCITTDRFTKLILILQYCAHCLHLEIVFFFHFSK